MSAGRRWQTTLMGVDWRRRWPWMALAGAVLVTLGPVPVVVGIAAVMGGRRLRALRERQRRRLDVQRGLPDVIDLLRLGADAGMTESLALAAVAEHVTGPLAVAVGSVLDRAARGVRLADALDGLRIDPVVEPLVDALVDTERYGTPLAEALGRVATDARDQRRRIAEQRARRLPVQLLAPLVVCALPATVALAVVPVGIVALEGIAL